MNSNRISEAEKKSRLFNESAVRSYSENRSLGDLVIDSRPIHVVLFAALLLLVATSVWATFALSISRNVAAPGEIVSLGGLIHVVGSPGMIIMERSVENGDWVEEGAVVAKLASRRFIDPDKDAYVVLSDAYSQLVERLQASVAGSNEEFKALNEDAKLRVESMNAQLLALQGEIKILRTRVNASASFVRSIEEKKKSGLSEYERKELLDRHYQLLAAEKAKERELAVISQELASARIKLYLLPIEQQNKITDLSNQIVNAVERQLKIKSETEIVVKSPVAGYVENFFIRPGDVVGDAPILSIMPVRDNFEVRGFLPVQSSGFVKVGQQVDITVDPFPYQKFGSVKGRVSYISSAADNGIQGRPPSYMVIISLETPYLEHQGKLLQFTHGMTVKFNIKLEKRRVIGWLIEPILNAKQRLN